MRRGLLLLALVTGCGEILSPFGEDPVAQVVDADASTTDATSGEEESTPDGTAGGEDAAGDALNEAADGGGVTGLRVFVSQQERTGASLGSDINSYCQSLATDAGLGGSWVSWLSDSTRNAGTVVRGNGPWRTLSGDVVAADKAALTNVSGQLAHGIDRDQKNMQVTGYVWTGTGPSGGVIAANHCSDWTGNAGAKGRAGFVGADTFEWTDAVTPTNCTVPAHVYCFEIPPQ